METNSDEMPDGVGIYEISGDFIQKVLRPYRANASYLKQATFYCDKDKGIDGLRIKGVFGIEESCYIDNTGHFNAVEYNICYNQLGYVFFAHCIEHKLLEELSDYTLDYFLENQLPNFLILKITSSFSSVLNAKHFHGTWGIKSTKKTSRLTFLNTFCDFEDQTGGRSSGEVTAGVLPAFKK